MLNKLTSYTHIYQTARSWLLNIKMQLLEKTLLNQLAAYIFVKFFFHIVAKIKIVYSYSIRLASQLASQVHQLASQFSSLTLASSTGKSKKNEVMLLQFILVGKQPKKRILNGSYQIHNHILKLNVYLHHLLL